MQNERKHRFIFLLFYLVGFFLFIVVCVAVILGRSSVTTSLLRDLAIGTLSAGLFLWIIARWKTRRVAMALVQVVGSGVLAFHFWIRHKDVWHLGFDISVVVCSAGLIQLQMAFKDLRSANNSEESMNPEAGKE
jgi:hypothetical protein